MSAAPPVHVAQSRCPAHAAANAGDTRQVSATSFGIVVFPFIGGVGGVAFLPFVLAKSGPSRTGERGMFTHQRG
jgi:hypothetical protein